MLREYVDTMTTISFRSAMERVGIFFLVVTILLYVVLWREHSVLEIFPYHALVWVAHVCAAYVMSTSSGRQGEAWDGDEFGSGFEELGEVVINPETGLTMVGGIGGVDAGGYSFGNGPDS